MSQWIKHDGGTMPCHPDAIVETRKRNGSKNVWYAKDEYFWKHLESKSRGSSEWDVVEYRIVEAPREPVRETRLTYIHSAGFHAGCMPNQSGVCGTLCEMQFIDGEPDWSTLRAVK